MGTVQQAAARMTLDASQTLIRNLSATPAEKQTWQPLDEGRSILNQVQECAVINAWFAMQLHDRAVPPLDGDAYAAALAQIDTADKATAALKENTDKLVEEIKAFPDAHLDESLTMPFGEGMVMTFEEILFAGYWNMTYHAGQIAYVQTLYGDKEMH
jgi:uncharacterized damage-inducible protein DinB